MYRQARHDEGRGNPYFQPNRAGWYGGHRPSQGLERMFVPGVRLDTSQIRDLRGGYPSWALEPSGYGYRPKTGGGYVGSKGHTTRAEPGPPPSRTIAQIVGGGMYRRMGPWH